MYRNSGGPARRESLKGHRVDAPRSYAGRNSRDGGSGGGVHAYRRAEQTQTAAISQTNPDCQRAKSEGT